MTDYKDKTDSKLSLSAKIREAEKMIKDGIPIEVICRVLKIPPDQLRYLRQQGDADFK